MPSDKNYTNLTVNRVRTEKARTRFEKLRINQTFNTWVLDTIESSIEKHQILNKNYPDYKFMKLEKEGFAIIDNSKDKIERVHYQGEYFICSEHGKEQCDHKLYATLHPQFTRDQK